MTINQALDKLTSKEKLTFEQQDLKFSLVNLKLEHGGRKKIENCEVVKQLIETGEKSPL